jgi:hypothetical protein
MLCRFCLSGTSSNAEKTGDPKKARFLDEETGLDFEGG